MAVQPLPQFHVVKESTAVKKARTAHQICHRVAVFPANDVTDITVDVGEQSNKDSVDDGFCGEPFADKGELLSSLSPLLFSMKLFGLYFHREHRHRRPTDDPEWNQTTSRTGTTSSRLRFYATVVLILIWVNLVRFTSAFTKSDHFGALLLMKITVFTWCGLLSIFQTTYYYASHTGQLVKILLSLPVTRDCVRHVQRAAVGLTVVISISLIGDLTLGAFIFYNSDDEYNFILAPLFTFIHIPNDKKVLKMVGYISYVLIFPGVLFAHALGVVLVYIFYNQFRKLKKHFRHALGKRGQFSGDLSAFRRRHQTLSRAVSKVDGFMMVSNVAGFVCHICNIIILLYSVFFYSEATKNYITALSYVFWLTANIHGLLLSASAGIIVNHMVRMFLAYKAYSLVWYQSNYDTVICCTVTFVLDCCYGSWTGRRQYSRWLIQSLPCRLECRW